MSREIVVVSDAEGIEDVWQHVGRDTDPLVTHGNPCALMIAD